MKIKSNQYFKDKGWTQAFDTNLDGDQTAIFVFASPIFLNNTQAIAELHKVFPKSIMIGCSGSGEINGAFVQDESLSIAIAKFEKTRIKSCLITIDKSADSYKAGQDISKLLEKEDLKGILVLSEGLNVNGTELAKGLNTISNKDVVITGGLAGDGARFQNTFVIADGKVYENKIVALGFYGNAVKIKHGSKGGWDIFGPLRQITRSKSNILYELDNKPALDLYKEYLGDKAQGLPATGLLFPLAIKQSLNEEKFLVRTILAIDEKEKSLTFAGDIPQGYLAQLMRANFDRLITGALEAGQMILDQERKPDQVELLLGISCVGRRLLLGERTEEEVHAIIESFPKNTTLVGFYSYGEISPFVKGSSCDLHNQTMTLTSIIEDV